MNIRAQYCRSWASQAGNTLVLFMIIMAVLASLAAGAFKAATLNMETTNSFSKGRKAFYSAEVGLDLAVNAVVNEFENLSVYTESADYAGADADGFITESDYRGYEVKYKVTNPVEQFLYQTIVGNTTIYHYAYTYNIESHSQSLKDKTKETVRETIRILETPLVQYFVFYGMTGNAADLELFPGPDMDMWGRIHSNGDIYIGSSSGNEIRLRNYDTSNSLSPHLMSAAGNVYNNTKDTPIRTYNNTVIVKTAGTGTTFSPTETVSTDITTANEATEETRFNDYVLIQEEPYSTPAKAFFSRGGFYEQRAGDPQRTTIDGIKIIGTGGLGSGTEVFVSRPSPNTDVTALVAAGESSAGVSTGLALPIIQETQDAFEDCREDGRDVDTTDIDLNLLESWYEAYLADNGLSLAGDGILIFTSRSPDASFDNQSGDLQAIRLVKLDATSSAQVSDETTLVTDNPVYIHGDFNTINTHGVAVIGDAINVLSNAFVTKPCGISQNTLFNNYKGTTTSVNAALFSGNLPTQADGSEYSGGVHSYPRLHEWWTGNSLNILGSFVNLWVSEQADGLWCLGGDCYSGPTRNWGWDIRFQDPDFWPPFIPSIYSVERVGFLE
ncbi:MAG: hypothetical protein G3M78_03465 [Candidatus Nitrohelix vancouverensis]|uniref:Type 4 fimbrial biogenesis protein PilX N-terminal domain-containing protein n=1 Tax=Candidatus Nitrohelix vancouverensis TaxID=2705534 RepID=A0A7T0G2M5_9BACT|nr:MAG: hypothetical protein G3M78_03465 [Candidatus Nitrohelix vancouverensis]